MSFFQASSLQNSSDSISYFINYVKKEIIDFQESASPFLNDDFLEKEKKWKEEKPLEDKVVSVIKEFLKKINDQINDTGSFDVNNLNNGFQTKDPHILTCGHTKQGFGSDHCYQDCERLGEKFSKKPDEILQKIIEQYNVIKPIDKKEICSTLSDATTFAINILNSDKPEGQKNFTLDAIIKCTIEFHEKIKAIATSKMQILNLSEKICRSKKIDQRDLLNLPESEDLATRMEVGILFRMINKRENCLPFDKKYMDKLINTLRTRKWFYYKNTEYYFTKNMTLLTELYPLVEQSTVDKEFFLLHPELAPHWLKNNPEFILALKYASNWLRDDKKVLDLIKKTLETKDSVRVKLLCKDLTLHASEKVKDDKEIALAILKHNIFWSEDCRKDTVNFFQSLSERLKNDKEIVRTILNHNMVLIYREYRTYQHEKKDCASSDYDEKISKCFKASIKFFMTILLKSLPEQVKNDKKIVWAILRHNIFWTTRNAADTIAFFKSLSEQLKNDKEFVLAILNHDMFLQPEERYPGERYLPYLVDRFYAVEEVFDTILKSLSEQLKNDKEFVSTILNHNQLRNRRLSFFESLPKQIQEDRKLILTLLNTLSKHWEFVQLLRWLPEELRGDKEIVLSIFNKAEDLKWTNNSSHDDEHKAFNFFQSLPEHLRNDKEIVLTFMKQCNQGQSNSPCLLMFQSLSHELKNDRDVVLLAILKANKSAGTLFESLPEHLKNNKEFVFEIMEKLCNNNTKEAIIALLPLFSNEIKQELIPKMGTTIYDKIGNPLYFQLTGFKW